MPSLSGAFGKSLAALTKSELDGGKLYLYCGTPPANADAALDMVATHTELVIVTNNDTGTGVTFQTPTDNNLDKSSSETWSGTASFSGKDAATSTLTPTFFRFCTSGDNGQGAANTSTGYRIQGTVSGPSGGGEMELLLSTITNGALVPAGLFRVTFLGG